MANQPSIQLHQKAKLVRTARRREGEEVGGGGQEQRSIYLYPWKSRQARESRLSLEKSATSYRQAKLSYAKLSYAKMDLVWRLQT